MSLVGPPQLRQIATSTSDAAAADSIPAASDEPFLDLMDANFNDHRPPMGFTENRSATFLSSGNPALDFFFQVVPDTAADVVTGLLSSAWAQDALTALKLVAHLRGVRGTGKSDKEGFYASALWLHENHPKTLALNVSSFAEFGYMKDLLEILYRLLNGLDTRKLAKDERNRAKSDYYGVRRWTRHRASAMKKPKKAQKAEAREKRIEDELAKMKMESEKAAELRRSKRTDLAKIAIERYNRDPNYRFLHDRISEFFAAMLESDAEQLKLGNLNKIGLAAKWCPSLDSSFDRSTLLCESIARRIWPKDSTDEYKEAEEEHYAYRVRDRLRREVLVPIRKALELPEVYMSAGKWDQLPYKRVASVAMKNYTKIFKKHDEARFSEYLSRVKEGKEKIAAGALLPHEILASAHDKEAGDVAELQWNRMVQDLLEKGKLKNCCWDQLSSLFGSEACSKRSSSLSCAPPRTQREGKQLFLTATHKG